MKESPNSGKEMCRQVGKFVAVVNKTIVKTKLLETPKPVIYNKSPLGLFATQSITFL